MENRKVRSPHRNTQNSPKSPVRKRTRFENHSCESSPQPSKDKNENQNQSLVTKDEMEQKSPAKATPENLDLVSGGNVTANQEFSVLQIPEYCRENFGIPDFWRLDNCKIGKHFWYDENHADHVKYFIALYNDESSHWNLTQKFTLKEQIGLQRPQIFKLSFNELLNKIGDNYKNSLKMPPRIWLDVRDFFVLFNANFESSNPNSSPIILIKSILKLVTHFSFGSRLYSSKEVSEEKLLSFILAHLKNVEYLCIQNEMLLSTKSSSEMHLNSSRHKINLPKLTTIRLSHYSRQNFSFQFIAELLLRSPNLENIYDIPLHLLSKIDQRVKDENHRSRKYSSKFSFNFDFKPMIRSVYTSRNHYARHRTAPDLFEDISIFAGSGSRNSSSNSSSKSKRALYEWSARIFFIFGFNTRAKCSKKISAILKENARTLERLSIEPPLEHQKDEMCQVQFPTLEKCTTLQVYLMKQEGSNHPIFPRGFNHSKKFPNLTHFEMILDRKFLRKASQIHPNYGSGQRSSRWSFFDECFPPKMFHKGSTFETVKCLTLINFSPYEIMPRLVELFPNVRVLRLTNGLLDVASVLHLCYKNWPRLEQLILEVNTDTKFLNLDAAFTGVAQKSVQTLAQALDPNSPSAMTIIEKNRIKLPISHLKELQLVKIILRSSQLFLSNQRPIFTPFSIYFGFDLANNPNLKIQVCFNDRVTEEEKKNILPTLESVLPFIELDD